MPADPPWPVWVISLRDAHERRARISDMLHELGINFTFLDAVDGRKGLSAEHESLVDRIRTLERDGTPMTDGEYACALSHQLAYARILEEDLPGAVILEDDAILTPSFLTFLEERTYRQAPLLQLFHFHARVWRGPGRKVPGGRIHRLAENAFMTVAYSISSQGARYIRQHGLPIRAPADWPCDVTRISASIMVPRPVLHPDPAIQKSNLADARGAKDISGYDPNRHFAKGIRRFITPASWRRFIMKRLSIVRNPGFQPLPGEHPMSQGRD